MCEMRRTLYGSVVPKNKLVGFCIKHRSGLTVNQLRKKKCLGKQCRHLQKYNAHPYWETRRIIKARKKQSKEVI